MEYVGKFDDTEVTALSHVTHATSCVHRGTLNRKGRLYEGKICTGLGARCPDEFPARQYADGRSVAEGRALS